MRNPQVSDPQLLDTGEGKARESDELNQTKLADHRQRKVLGRTAVLSSDTLFARASGCMQPGVVM